MCIELKNELEKLVKPWEEFHRLEWLEDLIWCPSQISYRFVYEGQRFEIYLRWRHYDPWTCDLISYPPNSEDDEWHAVVEFPFFKDQEYKEAEAWCEYWLLQQIQTKELNKYLVEHGEIF